MKKKPIRLLSAAMSLAMVLGLLGGCGANVEEHDHADDAAELTGGATLELLADEAVPLAGGTCENGHNFQYSSTEEGTDCTYGTVEYKVFACTNCGAYYHTAIRKVGNEPGPNEQHSLTKATESSGCPNNPIEITTCSKCTSYRVITGTGAHSWSEWKADDEHNPCTDTYEETRSCSCGASETRTHKANGHSWRIESETEATCTEPGKTTRVCNVCGTEETVESSPLGHLYQAGATCEDERKCERCGATAASTGHKYGTAYESDSTAHWQVCINCGTESARTAHADAGNGYCVCGYKIPSCKHNWTVTGSYGVLNHNEKCTLCGATRLVTCAAEGNTKPRTSCLEDIYCVCGNKIGEGQKNHNYGTWICHDSTHEHKCLNPTCNSTVSEPHTLKAVGSVMKCSVCGFIDKTAAPPHTHTFGAWTVGSNGCVRYCTDPTCTASETAAHKAGPADCAGNAVCVNCGASVKAAPSSTHTGSTVVKGYTAPEVGKAGYTGDTYCTTCNKIIAKGQTIEALKPSHVHAYTTLQHDSTGHWNVCECGDKEAVSAHTGGTATCAAQAVCSVCGEKYGALNSSSHVGGTEIVNSRAAEVGVPGYTGDEHCLGCGALLKKGAEIPALTPQHEHAYTLKSDSLRHWQECECGDAKDAAEHTYVNGVCSVCGAREPEKVETHVHTYSAEWSHNDEYHWHECTSCGTETDGVAHVFLDGVCAVCGKVQPGSGLADPESPDSETPAPAENVVAKFADVKQDWYTDAVQRVYSAGLMRGTGDNIFGLDTKASRITVMTILARINHVEGADGADWNAVQKAVEDWAVGNRIADAGSRDAEIKRGEIVLMLWRSEGSPAEEFDVSRFSDLSSLDAETLSAVKWAVKHGILNGAKAADGTLTVSPESEASRAEIAALLVRYMDM